MCCELGVLMPLTSAQHMSTILVSHCLHPWIQSSSCLSRSRHVHQAKSYHHFWPTCCYSSILLHCCFPPSIFLLPFVCVVFFLSILPSFLFISPSSLQFYTFVVVSVCFAFCDVVLIHLFWYSLRFSRRLRCLLFRLIFSTAGTMKKLLSHIPLRKVDLMMEVILQLTHSTGVF